MKPLRKCCCFPVRTGALILGILGLIGWTILTIIYSAAFDNIDYFYKGIDEAEAEYSKLHDQQLLSDTDYVYLINLYESLRHVLSPTLIVGIVCGTLSILINGLMVAGINMKKPGMMLPAIITGIIGIVSQVCWAIYQYLNIAINVSAGIGIGCLIFSLLWFGLCFFFWFVIYSAYKEIKDEKMNVRLDMQEKVVAPPPFDYGRMQ